MRWTGNGTLKSNLGWRLWDNGEMVAFISTAGFGGGPEGPLFYPGDDRKDFEEGWVSAYIMLDGQVWKYRVFCRSMRDINQIQDKIKKLVPDFDELEVPETWVLEKFEGKKFDDGSYKTFDAPSEVKMLE